MKPLWKPIALAVAIAISSIPMPTQTFPPGINRWSVGGIIIAITSFTFLSQTQSPLTMKYQHFTGWEKATFIIGIAGFFTAFVGATLPYSKNFKPESGQKPHHSTDTHTFSDCYLSKRKKLKPNAELTATPAAAVSTPESATCVSESKTPARSNDGTVDWTFWLEA